MGTSSTSSSTSSHVASGRSPARRATWANWSQSAWTESARLHFAYTVADVQATVASATEAGTTVRVVGSGHSHYPLVPTEDLILDLSAMGGLLRADEAAGRATVAAGTVISRLGPSFHSAGLALSNQGDIDRQTIGGAVATGTHGTGIGLQNLSASVTGFTLVTAAGELVRCNREQHGDLFRAARLNLGAFGVVIDIELALRKPYRLVENGWAVTYDELREGIEARVAEHRHFEFFWYPETDQAIAKTLDETTEPAAYPIAQEGKRRGWNYEVLPNHRPHLHTEMEFAIPLDRSLECLDEIRSLLRLEFPELKWPVEYRTVAADDVWLSQAFGHDVATISLHQGIGEHAAPPAEELFAAAEAIVRRYDNARPHWGKVHGFTGADLAAVHPRWADWWEARDAVDPTGTFLNPALRSLRSPPAHAAAVEDPR